MINVSIHIWDFFLSLCLVLGGGVSRGKKSLMRLIFYSSEVWRFFYVKKTYRLKSPNSWFSLVALFVPRSVIGGIVLARRQPSKKPSKSFRKSFMVTPNNNSSNCRLFRAFFWEGGGWIISDQKNIYLNSPNSVSRIILSVRVPNKIANLVDHLPQHFV